MNIRDLLAGDPHPDEALTLKDIAHERVTERTVVVDPHAKVTARMPGDPDDHPHKGELNPMPGVDRIEMFRLLMAKELPGPLAAKVKAYLALADRT